MERDLNIYLKDALNAIEIIEGYTKKVDFKAFSKSSLIQDAVIRRFIVIGEAFSRYKHRLPEDDKNFPYVHAISMKNFLVHEYEKVELQVVWDTVKIDLPDLKKKVKKLIK